MGCDLNVVVNRMIHITVCDGSTQVVVNRGNINVSVNGYGWTDTTWLGIDGKNANQDIDIQGYGFKAGNLETRYVDFDLSYVAACIEGRMQWNGEYGTLDVGMPGGNVCLPLGEKLLLQGKNESGSDILKGKVVRISGASGARPHVDLADASDHVQSRSTIAVAGEDIVKNQIGFSITFGYVRGMDTSAYVEGTPVFLDSTAGEFVYPPPEQPNSQVFVGVVLRSHATEGVLFVRIQSITNLDELSDVLANTLVDDDFLVRNETSGVWENKQLDTIADGIYIRRDGTLPLLADWDAGNHKITAEKLEGSTKYGVLNSVGDDVYYTVDEFTTGPGFFNARMPLLVPKGAGIFHDKGALLNSLYIVDPEQPTLVFSDLMSTFYSVFQVNVLAGETTFGAVIGTLNGTTWNDDFITPDNYKQIFGTGLDVEMYFDGIDFITKTNILNPSDWLIDCGTQKTIELVTPVTEDLQFPISGARVPAVNAPTWEPLTSNHNAYSFGVNDYKDFEDDELPHWWVEGTDGKVHLHITTRTSNVSGVDQFAKYNVYIAHPNASGIWIENIHTAELTIPDGTLARQKLYLAVGTETLTGLTLGTQIGGRVERIAATGGVEYPDNIFITQTGIHLFCNTLGSRQEGIK
ncbi:hypothetical protein KAR91_31355 [Candidatus Pacearchaeota archaeon]|nr:hypothetical protein [Candidatus Pacearchaeota archaeon]